MVTRLSSQVRKGHRRGWNPLTDWKPLEEKWKKKVIASDAFPGFQNLGSLLKLRWWLHEADLHTRCKAAFLASLRHDP